MLLGMTVTLTLSKPNQLKAGIFIMSGKAEGGKCNSRNYKEGVCSCQKKLMGDQCN